MIKLKTVKPRLNRISIVLDEFNFSQKDLALYLNVSKNTVNRWCRNINQPDLEKIYEIASFFRTDVRHLLEPTLWDAKKDLAPYKLFLDKKNKTIQSLKASRKLK